MPHARAALFLVSMPLAVVIGVLVAVVGTHHSARADGASDAVLEMRGAPLASVLDHLAAIEGGEAHVDDSVTDTLDGSLVGEPGELMRLLIESHHLELFQDGDNYWFDRPGRTIVDFVPLQKSDIVLALRALAAPVAPGGTVQVEASERGLVLNGSRAYVRTSLARIALATGKAVEPPRFASGHGDEEKALPPISALAGRVVLLSPTEPAFAELDDGTRLSVGDTLEDGRQLATIERQRMVFRREGEEAAFTLR